MVLQYLVPWLAAPRVWTLRAPTKNLLTYLLPSVGGRPMPRREQRLYFFTYAYIYLCKLTYIWTFSTIPRLLTDAEYILLFALRLAAEVRRLTQSLRLRQSVRCTNNTAITWKALLRTMTEKGSSLFEREKGVTISYCTGWHQP